MTRAQQLPEYLRKHRIEYLYHLTSIRNLRGILRQGILSHNEAYQQGVILDDISMEEVQDIRHRKLERVSFRPIHDYASLYFNARNPMLFKRKEQQQNLAILGVDPIVLAADGTVFTDGNAANTSTKFYHNLSDLDKLPWTVLNDPFWNRPQYEDGKRQKCAEVLVFPMVQSTLIRRIFVLDDNAAKTALRAIPVQSPVTIIIAPEKFFE